jgi:hypothetical protein
MVLHDPKPIAKWKRVLHGLLCRVEELQETYDRGTNRDVLD